jgi:Flp pilus assembly protein TadB
VSEQGPIPGASRREEQRAQRRRRAALRLDLLIAGLVALAAILLSPGIAIAGIVAAIVLIVAGVWALVERRAQRRRQRATTVKKSRA